MSERTTQEFSRQLDRRPEGVRPSVSVLMACYNAEAYVAEAIESILQQTLKQFELIIVDDGSTDRSRDVVAKYKRECVTLLEQDHLGASKARNAAFHASQGDFVIFVDADDLIAPCHLEALLQCALKNPGCIALSKWDRFQKDPSEARFPKRVTEADLAGADWLELDWRGAQGMTQSGMLLLPRNLLEAHGLWNEDLSLHDDFEFFARMISRSGGIRFAPEAALYYRSGIPNNMSSQRSRVAVESAFLSLSLGTQHLLSVKDTVSARHACANLFKAFDHRYFPFHSDLRTKACRRAVELGGASIEPFGPPAFQRLRPWIGWKAARLAQLTTERLGLNSASRRGWLR